ncbi:hypothetical protein RFA54_001611 [Vibrio vulnificus]|nr:hypothetical protein [Vibrio vulnificus]
MKAEGFRKMTKEECILNWPGRLKIFVDGIEVNYVFYANTAEGIVKYYPHPLSLEEGSDEIRTETLKGIVTVEFSI